jgi:molecular chaperone GrpE
MDKHKEQKSKEKDHHEHKNAHNHHKDVSLKKDFDSSDEDLEKKMADEKISEERRRTFRREADRIADELNTNTQKENQKLKEDIDALKDIMLRRQADFENYKKRMAKQQLETRKMAIRDITHDIILINDDLLRAIEASESITQGASTEEMHRSFVEGVSMISSRIEETMHKYGVKEIEALNQEFDPNCHEAVEIDVSDSVGFDTVTKVYQKGFRIEDLVVRSAKVRVTKAKKEEAPAAAENQAEEGDATVH